RLSAYLDLLARWNPRINLVAAPTLRDPWRRHVLDSAQLLPDVSQRQGALADLGTGAGFPGLVLAILGRADVILIESDQRKCAFLREVARLAGVAVDIRNGRMEAIPPAGAAIVTARACAPLATLLGYAERHLAPGGVAIFLKGRNMASELADAGESWRFAEMRRPSLADAEGWVIRLEDIRRA
ncbi:MAG: 16S rRNA (guanine(527)-N(7))-methyltransferase RsmG, partial [Alphaproteobacteria bacterium]